MGKALHGDARLGRSGRSAGTRRVGLGATAIALAFASAMALFVQVLVTASLRAQSTATAARPDGASKRLDRGRFTVVYTARDARLAQSLLDAALRQDSFPGLPRPRARVLVAVAPDAERFRAWAGPAVPEWGAAIALPDEQRVIMQGASAGSDAGDPLVVLRHELAHLALHEALGPLPARWFDEGYASVAAREWTREATIETSSGMVFRTLPTLSELEEGFGGTASRASWSYALAYRAVFELSALDTLNGLTNLFREWKRTGAFEPALRSAYGMTGEQFDRYWRQRTRRRFGVVALVANLSAAVGFFGLLLGPLFWLRWRRDRRRMHALRQADELQERALAESALAAMLAGPNSDVTGPG